MLNSIFLSLLLLFTPPFARGLAAVLAVAKQREGITQPPALQPGTLKALRHNWNPLAQLLSLGTSCEFFFFEGIRSFFLFCHVTFLLGVC